MITTVFGGGGREKYAAACVLFSMSFDFLRSVTANPGNTLFPGLHEYFQNYWWFFWNYW